MGRCQTGKHDIDFFRAMAMFDGPHCLSPGKTVNGEVRQLATGWVHDRWITIVFTRRDDVIRIISARRARGDEKRRYQAILGD